MSKLNAKWLNFDTSSLENSSGDLQLNIDTTSNTIVKTAEGVQANSATVALLTGNQTIDGTKTFGEIPILPGTNPQTDNDAVRKGYVDGLLTGLTWEDPIYSANQLVNGATGTGGIRPAAYIDLDATGAAWSVGNTIVVDWNDGSAKTFTLSAVDNASPGNDEFDINVGAGRGGESSTSLATEIIRSVNDSTTAAMAAVQGQSDRSVDSAYFVNDDAAEWTSFTVTVTGPTEGTDYKKADGAGPNLGQLYASLQGNQTHFSRGDDNGYTWSDDTEMWIQVTGVGSLPNATRTQHGVIEVHDGLTVSNGELSVYLDTSAGLELSGAVGEKQLGIAADGVLNTMINWGTATVDQIDAADVPILDASAKITATNVDGALTEIALNVESNGSSISTNASNISTNSSNIGTNSTNIDDLEGKAITGGDGITSTGTLDAGITISVDLGTEPGLEFITNELEVKIKPASGLTKDANGIYVGDDQILDTMINFGTGATQINAEDIPVIDASSLITATTVEGALEELKNDIDTVANAGVTGGDGITTAGDVGALTVSVDILDASPGLMFAGAGTDELAVKLKASGGIAVDSDGLYLEGDDIVENLALELITLDSTSIADMYVDLTNIPESASATALDISGGIMQQYSKDYAVVTDGADVKRVTWNSGDANVSTGISGLEVGDVLMVHYSH